jgi:NAD(P)H-nitrite reductase large subunit
MEIVIVGGGAAGLQAAVHCRQYWPQKSMTLIEAEAEIGYSRPLLPQFMAGQVDEEKLFFWRPAPDPLFQVRTGIGVQFIDRKNQTLQLENQEWLHYERLILAPGGMPFIPAFESENSLEGIFPVRSLSVARKVREWLSSHPEIFILGGGLVGVKTALHLGLSGLQVSLVEKEDHLLPQALTARAARLVGDHLRRMGIHLFLGSLIEGIQGEKGVLKSIKLGGRWIPCDTLLIAAGSTPNVDFLEGTGLLKNGELLVSATLQTQDEKIFAAGDAVAISNPQGKNLTPWTWPQAVVQGKLAAANLYKSAPIPLNVLTRPNSLNLHGLSIVILGAPVPEAEVISYEAPSEGVYRELFLLGGRIVGGALVGDISGAGPLHHLMINGKEAGSEVYKLISPSLRVMPQDLLDYGIQRRRARFISMEDKNQC